MSMRDPGLDRHEWESEYAALEDDLRDDPRSALPELLGLVERMLEERGYELTDDVVFEGEERDVVAEYAAARDTARRVDAGADVGPGDVGEAIHGLQAIYETLIAERSTP